MIIQNWHLPPTSLRFSTLSSTVSRSTPFSHLPVNFPMDKNSNSAGAVTPVKNSRLSRSKSDNLTRNFENSHPNTSPSLKQLNEPSPLIKSTATKAKKKCSPVVAAPLPIKEKVRERKFLIAKKNSKRDKVNHPSTTTVACICDSKADGKPLKCRCVAYESLRASQDLFFKNNGSPINVGEKEYNRHDDIAESGIELQEEIRNTGDENADAEKQALDEKVRPNDRRISDSNMKRRRDKLLEDARESLPESGRVMHLVKAFETLLTLPKSSDFEHNNYNEREGAKKGIKWALPGLPSSLNIQTQVSSSSLCPSDFSLTSESLGLSCSVDSCQGSACSRTSGGDLRSSSRRNSAESSGTFARRQWKKRQQQRATRQKPFKLRTELRGRQKQEEFIKKVHHMMEEEEKLRIPVAQGLPWTTDEPECLVKPPVKEGTRPVDLVLNTDIRAEERAEFDHQVAEKMNLIEQYKMERERQQKLAEEEEIRRLRKELVPKAQPMPYFDKPFLPRRSAKHPTIPKEPKFHIPQHKKIKCCMSWSDHVTCTELQ